jgi:hypothetical protein
VAGCEWCVARFDGYGGRDVLVGRKAAVWGNANVTVRKRRVVDGDIFVCFIITQGGIDGCRGERVVVEELTIRVIGGWGDYIRSVVGVWLHDSRF